MSEKIEKKIKGFRIPIEKHDVVDELVKQSGKESGEWFEDVIHQISINELVLDKNGIPANLRTHFSSDIAAMKEATNSIQTLFINQMNRIAVEKNNWAQILQEKEKTQDEKVQHLRQQIGELEREIQNRDANLDNANQTILQYQNKVDGFDKLEAHLRKDIERLEREQEKLSEELEVTKAALSREKELHLHELQDLKLQHKEEKSLLNERIVELIEQIKNLEPIREEHQALQDRIKELQTTINQNKAEYEFQLNRIQEQSDMKSEKLLLSKERELRESFFVQSREDMKDLYEKIERLQADKNKLEIENERLKSQSYNE